MGRLEKGKTILTECLADHSTYDDPISVSLRAHVALVRLFEEEFPYRSETSSFSVTHSRIPLLQE